MVVINRALQKEIAARKKPCFDASQLGNLKTSLKKFKKLDTFSLKKRMAVAEKCHRLFQEVITTEESESVVKDVMQLQAKAIKRTKGNRFVNFLLFVFKHTKYKQYKTELALCESQVSLFNRFTGIREDKDFTYALINSSNPLSSDFSFLSLFNSKNDIDQAEALLNFVENKLYASKLQRFNHALLEGKKTDDELKAQFQALPEPCRKFLSHCVWAANRYPIIIGYGERKIYKNIHILTEISDPSSRNLVEQLRDHYRAAAKLEEEVYLLLELQQGLKRKVKPEQLKEVIEALPPKTKGKLLKGKSVEKFLKNRKDAKSEVKRLVQKKSYKARHQMEKTYKKLQPRIIKGSKVETEEKDHQGPVSINRVVTHIPADQVKEEGVRATFVTAECSKILKQGGLAEAVYGMAKGLTEQNPKNQVRIIMPKYDTLPPAIEKQLKEKEEYSIVDQAGKVNRVFKAKIGEVKVYFIEDTAPEGEEDHQDRFAIKSQKEPSIYGPDDDAVKERFVYFSSCATELLRKLESKTDVIHLHDWHTASVAHMLRHRHATDWKEGKIPPVLFTFHNNNHAAQGHYYHPHNRFLHAEGIKRNHMNMVVQGLEDADFVTTVSETFAVEAQGKIGKDIDHKVRKAARNQKLVGILNGSNPTLWDPETNGQLQGWVDPETGEATDLSYGPKDDILAKRALIKEQLQKWATKRRPELEIDFSKPVVTFVGRFDSYQKGLDMFDPAIESALKSGAQVVIMGSQEDKQATKILDKLQAKYPKGVFFIRDKKVNGRYEVQQGTDTVPGIGSLIRAGSEFTLVPSEFEPCGLVQFEGWLFGSLAIGSDTGGLADSIETEGEHFNGFLFERMADWHTDAQRDAVRATVAEAITTYGKMSDEKKLAIAKRLIVEARQCSWTTAPRGLSPVEKYRYAYLEAARRAQKRNHQLIQPGLLTT